MAFNFAFITDTHLYPDAPQDFGAGVQQSKSSVALYSELIRQLNEFGPEFVIHGGDIVCGGDSFEMPVEQYEAALGQAKQFGEQLHAPCYYIPGNHDLNPVSGSKTAYLNHFGIDGLAYTSFVHEDLRFILLDTQEVDRDLTHGHIGETQLEWFSGELQAAADAAQEVFIFSHQLLFPPEEFDGLGARIDNPEAVLEILDQFNHVLAAFHGHLHINRVINRRDVFYAITSAVICYPMMWRQVFVEAEHIHVKSCQLNLPDIVASSADAQPERHQHVLGSEADREFTIRRGQNSPDAV
jgi:3',5'-cyclic AMP phosphodiesterase CpdA